MSYDPTTDFLGLLRSTGGGVQSERMPGLDFTVAALARMGFINLFVGQTAPTSNQPTTAWFKPAIPSWTAEGVLYLWDAVAGSYQVATPALWSAAGPTLSLQAIGMFTTRTAAAAAIIAPGLPFLSTAGLTAVGDGGQNVYKPAGGSSPGAFQSAGGQWWQPVNPNLQAIGMFTTRTAAAAAIIDPELPFLSTVGLTSAGDGGGLTYKPAADGTNPGSFQSADGQWWQPVNPSLQSLGIFATRTAAAAAFVPSGLLFLYTDGYAAAGDGGQASYVRTGGSTQGGFQSADGQWWKIAPGQTPNLLMFGGKADNGVTDNGPPLTAMLTFAAGTDCLIPVAFGAKYAIKTPVTYTNTVLFGPNMRLRGAGSALTVLDNQCTTGFAMIRAAATVNNFSRGGYIRDMTITTTTGSGIAGIDLYATWQFDVENVHIIGLAENGATMTCNLGDSDALNIVKWKGCRFENNGNAGLACNFAVAIVQPSFVHVEDCFFAGNTLAGYYWIGLSGYIVNCAFAANKGPGLWAANNGGSTAQVTCIGTSFENNLGTAVELQALQGGAFIDCEIANNVGNPATIGFGLTGCSGIHFDATRVRVSCTPCTAFELDATSNHNHIENTTWVATAWTDAAGQVRFAVDPAATGNRIIDNSNGVAALTLINGNNNDIVLPPGSVEYTVAGPTGAFNINGFAGGWDGREITLYNTSAQTGTIKPGTGSSATNQIFANGGANVTYSNEATATFKYVGGTARWFLKGVG